jgi:hypothetical protein
MPIREIAKYQQTFHGTADDNEFTFSFYRVYKSNQKNKFRVRVVHIADHRVAEERPYPNAYFAQDLTNGTSTYSDEITQGGTGMKTNEFCLGIVMPLYFGANNYTTSTTNPAKTPYDLPNGTTQKDTAGLTSFLAPEFIVDELSTSPFIVAKRHVGIADYSTTDVGFMITFEITEIEEVPY